MFRKWLMTLLSRPRVSEEPADSTAEAAVVDTHDADTTAQFQPIRSQEEIQKEEAAAKATTKRSGVISRLFDDDEVERPVRSRP